MINTHERFLCLSCLRYILLLELWWFVSFINAWKNPWSRNVFSACFAPVSCSPFHVVLRPLILESPILWADTWLCEFLGCYGVFQQELMCPYLLIARIWELDPQRHFKTVAYVGFSWHFMNKTRFDVSFPSKIHNSAFSVFILQIPKCPGPQAPNFGVKVLLSPRTPMETGISLS